MKVKHVMREVELGTSHCDDEGKGRAAGERFQRRRRVQVLGCPAPSSPLLSRRRPIQPARHLQIEAGAAGECERASAQGATHTRKRQREMGKGKAGRRTSG